MGQTVTEPTTRPSARWRRAWDAAALPLGLYVAARLATLVAFALAARVVGRSVHDSLFLWDGTWYERVAVSGYPDHVPEGQSVLAFFPLYPLLARWLDWATPLGIRASLLAVSAIGGAGFVIVTWHLLLRLMPRAESERALALVVLTPGVFVLAMAYSEGLMLLLAALCLLALHDEKWVQAGVWGALATATRPNALALVLAAAGAAVLAYRRGAGLRPFVAPLLAPLGFVAFQAYLAVHTGELMAWSTAQRRGWDEGIDFGWTTIQHIVDAVPSPLTTLNKTQAAYGAIVFVALLVYAAWRRLPLPLFLYSLGVTGVALASQSLGARPRYLLTAFPLLFPLAGPMRDLRLSAWVGFSMALMAGLVFVTVSSLLLTP